MLLNQSSFSSLGGVVASPPGEEETVLWLSQILRFPLLRARILVQVTIYRRLLIGRDGHLDQSEAYDIS